ncbi:unnamed protein product [Parascedosporium putredinis]|uniref:Oxysterol-binding protein-like protein 1 n=1 Tax=Parascedosporium putredinis TaxID=1442378 RepID=A0A9P1ME53_9PEZI|nr:unnamed protein product [Parascedosporium putredinis]CAI8003979.1 unnamed protein product [Parascedosporium putredinis]
MATAVAATPTAEKPEENPSDGSKLKTFITILKKFIGVADLANVRFSLPSQLLEPTPNLEYWNYLDAPNAFVGIGTSDEPLDRMLEVLRFWFTKDLKYAKGRPCKPYNSCLGEFFRCNWETENNAPRICTNTLKGNASGASSVKSAKSSSGSDKNASTISLSISAKFTGTTIKVSPGEHNMGIFISLDKRGGETYQLTHPAAHLGGFLGATKLKAILSYAEEGWLGRTTNKVQGIIFTYDPENDDKTRIQDVPEQDILARLGGPWKEKIVLTLGSKPLASHPVEDQYTIIDIAPLSVAPKVVPPREKQLPHESLTMWAGVTDAIMEKQYSKATTVKMELEESQREKARQRERDNVVWKPVFFTHVTGNGGRPDLTPEGQEVLKRAQEGNWDMEGIL